MKMNIKDDYMINHIATWTPPSSCKMIRAALLGKGTNVSFMTVSRCLSNEFGLKSHNPAHRPCVTTAMEFKHLDLAKKYEHWTAEQWGKVLFSDELPVLQIVVCTRHVRRQPGKRFAERYTISTTKHPPSQMIFFAILEPLDCTF